MTPLETLGIALVGGIAGALVTAWASVHIGRGPLGWDRGRANVAPNAGAYRNAIRTPCTEPGHRPDGGRCRHICTDAYRYARSGEGVPCRVRLCARGH